MALAILAGMRELLRRYPRTVLYAFALGLLLRLAFVVWFPNTEGDAQVYADIARNWLHHGMFAITDSGVPAATYIRLPGYPAFLAATFAVQGRNDLHLALYLQALLDLVTCCVVAALAGRICGATAARRALWLAALCPFTANYVASALSETLSILMSASAVYYGYVGWRALVDGREWRKKFVIAGAAVAAAILLRPDGGLLLIAMLAALAWAASRKKFAWKQAAAAGVLLSCVALLPLVPWTLRNWRVFHEFQPLAPRYANSPGELIPVGLNHWTKTWLVDYQSVEDVYWKVSPESDAAPVDIDSLPARAFDDESQRKATEDLVDDYNDEKELTAELDARFEALAQERNRRHPLRNHLVLPVMRVLDMWLRPRTEMLPMDHHFWPEDSRPAQAVAAGFLVLNLALLLVAARGWEKVRTRDGVLLLVGFVVTRSLFLLTLENPEPRYVLECFPVVLALAACGWGRKIDRGGPVAHAEVGAEVL